MDCAHKNLIWISKIHRVLKQLVVLPEDVLPVWERLPRVLLVARKNINLADAALVDAIHNPLLFG
jgi:hypothetical protein